MNETIQMLDQLQEQVKYKNEDFPLAIFYDVFDFFADNSFYCHWHEEIELAVVLKGSVKYLLDQTPYVVEAGNGLFIGSRVLHSAKQLTDNSIVFNILFPNRIFSQVFNNLTFYKCASRTPNWFRMSCPLDQNIPEENEILRGLIKIEQSLLDENCELAQLEAILHVWQYLSKIFVDAPASYEPQHLIREERMRNMISYIHANYMHHITAVSIAAAANISRSECFRCFSLFGETSPVDYLNKYRLQIAVKKLLETNASVSDISLSCGFSSTSYFSKTFKDNYGISPLSFRKQGEARFLPLA